MSDFQNLLLASLFLTVSLPTIASNPEKKIPTLQGIYQFTFEELMLPQSEKLGLLGGNALIENEYGYAGLGIYGAVTGKRGGFFTGGLHLGKHYPITAQYFIDGNIFVGGGGGGSAPQGGGLMLRGALGIGKKIDNNRYFLGLSHVQFPNGQIESTQLSLAFSRSFTAMHFPSYVKSSLINWNKILQDQNDHKQQFSTQVLYYFPNSGIKGRNQKPHEKQLGVLGIRVSSQLSDLFWSEFETGGAMSGGIDGFAQVLGGLSFKKAIFRKVTFSTGWLLGAAGGGNVDTGGGTIHRIFSGVEIALNQRFSTYIHLGYTAAVNADFSAKVMNVNLVYNYKSLTLTKDKSFVGNRGKLHWRKLRIRPGMQRYAFYQQNSRKFPGQKNLDVDLANLKLDAFYSNRGYLTGQALGAFDGKAGGYAVGLVGTGYRLTPNFGAELLIGVAGGGGIAVGSGKVIQPMLDFTLPMNRQWSMEFSVGYLKAIDGNLSSIVFNTGLVYHFLMPYR